MALKLLTEQDEDRIYAAQGEEAERLYGSEAAGLMNLGWGVDTRSVSSKVYRREGHRVITSWVDAETDEVLHEWSDYK